VIIAVLQHPRCSIQEEVSLAIFVTGNIKPDGVDYKFFRLSEKGIAHCGQCTVAGIHDHDEGWTEVKTTLMDSAKFRFVDRNTIGLKKDLEELDSTIGSAAKTPSSKTAMICSDASESTNGSSIYRKRASEEVEELQHTSDSLQACLLATFYP
jgi:hypothetical protein